MQNNAMQKANSICHLRCLVLHALGHPRASALETFGPSLFQWDDMFEAQALDSPCCECQIKVTVLLPCLQALLIEEGQVFSAVAFEALT